MWPQIGVIAGSSILNLLQNHLAKSEEKKQLKKQGKQQKIADLINSLARGQRARAPERVLGQSTLTSGLGAFNQTVSNPMMAQAIIKLFSKIK